MGCTVCKAGNQFPFTNSNQEQYDQSYSSACSGDSKSSLRSQSTDPQSRKPNPLKFQAEDNTANAIIEGVKENKQDFLHRSFTNASRRQGHLFMFNESKPAWTSKAQARSPPKPRIDLKALALPVSTEFEVKKQELQQEKLVPPQSQQIPIDTTGRSGSHKIRQRKSAFRQGKQLKINIEEVNANSRHRQASVKRLNPQTPTKIPQVSKRLCNAKKSQSSEKKEISDPISPNVEKLLTPENNISGDLNAKQDDYARLIKNHSSLNQSPLKDKGYKLKIDKSQFVQEQKGRIKAKYRILETIGKGTYGEVKKIIHKNSGQVRAMKIIRKGDVSAEYVKSLLNEIDILKQMDHPNIVKLFEFYQDKLNFYLITEFIQGGELFDQITKIKSFSEPKAAKIMRQLLSAVVYCHKKKIVHRDLKPENLLLENANSENIKVIDFGTSSVFDPNTKMSHKYGTPYYIAPEVLSKQYDEKCDVWSCGVIMYILLCGYPPFKGKNHKEIFEKIKIGKFSFAATEWKNISKEAKYMIKRMLTFLPDERVSAEQALTDKWIVELTSLGENMPKKQFHQPIMLDILNNIKKITIQQKLQQAVLSYFANYLNFDYEKEKLLDIFQAFDKNHDGQIDQQELLDGYIEFFDGDAERAEREVQEIMEKLDFNGNGSIDYSEFAIANIDMNKLLSEDKLKEAFELFDIDRGGSITTDEIKKILGNGNKSEIDDNEWERILDEVDADGNGEIDFEEFKHMMYKVLDVKHKAPYTETQDQLNQQSTGGKQPTSNKEQTDQSKHKKQRKKRVIRKKHHHEANDHSKDDLSCNNISDTSKVIQLNENPDDNE